MRVRVARAALLALIAASLASAVRCSSETGTPSARETATSSPSSSSSAAPTIGKDATALNKFRAEIKSSPSEQWSLLETAVLAPRDRGEWDDYRVGSPVVMTETAAPAYRMWFVGCHLAQDRYDCGIGHATSADGIEWTRRESPVFVPQSAAHGWINTIAVLKTTDRYLMWYSMDGDADATRPRATLHLATSADGIEWQDAGQVYEAASDRSRAIRHAIYHDGKIFHLWYFDFIDDRSERLFHVTSPDGKTWTSVGADSLADGAGRVGRPWITSDGHRGYRALVVDYRNRGGRPVLRWLTSADGTNWTDGAIERESRIAGDGTSIFDITGEFAANGLWIWTTTAVPSRRTDESISVAYKKGSGS
jgi:hypothetical protein